MTAIGERVAEHLRAHPGCTVDEVARAVHARTSTVRAELADGRYIAAARDEYPGDRALVYRLRDGSGRANSGSQCDRLLRILADGRWHNSADLHRAVFCVLHSRIAELRHRGYLIERRGAGPGAHHHDYRLVTAEERAA